MDPNARFRNRRLEYAGLCLLSVPLSFLLNFSILSAPVEAFLTSLGLPSGWPARLAALGISGIFYMLGAKYAVARRNGEPAWVFPLMALAIATTVGAAAWETARAHELPGFLPEAMGLLSLAESASAFIVGTGIPEALRSIRRHQRSDAGSCHKPGSAGPSIG
jgi:hypothetical protein